MRSMLRAIHTVIATLGVAACAAQTPAPATGAAPSAGAATSTATSAATATAAPAGGEKVGMVGIKRLDVPYVAEMKYRSFFEGLQKANTLVRDARCGGDLWIVERVEQTAVTLGRYGETAGDRKCTVPYMKLTEVFLEQGAPTLYHVMR